ncbi:hypothetical protein [Pseudomonas aeruginosa]|uniref:hypothetical protein n=2 Tax=Pseudomonas aeruginosa TaxID=287 RepID=UPI000E3178DA|nr:hypothetical protein [Pseudomonas aeruginosa]EJH4826985.1 hypothetical protein [Pseudomonas aeruginosa]EKX5105783.1 hypothetical protein [Pseudomonas aeruginosa]EMC2520333.1 hypothetical protein [Pseudomonas aeruginosa]MBG5323301.1 hypothetical protein [Pseudomonas aeruginosa]MCW5526036.1 hypothetical protein [Pseudomonas aeruginosa]
MTESKICTCPSGDGSLRWPCPAHPAEQAGGDERAAFKTAYLAEFDCDADGDDNMAHSNTAWRAWKMARAALAQPSPVRSSLLINGYQLRAALDFIAPDGTAEQLKSEACIEWRQQDADFLEAGLYAFCAEYPEEGGVLLDEEPTTAQPSPLQSEQAEAERPEVAEVAFVLRNIGAMDAEDIDGDNVDLRFEDAEGRDTGCDVSIVEYAEKAADLFEQHDRIVGDLRAKAVQLREALEWRKENQAGQRELLRSVTAERDAALARVAELAQALRHLLHNIKASGKRIDLGLAKECAEDALARIDSTVAAQAQHSGPEEFSFEYRHPNGESHTVTVSRDQVINEMPDFLFEALCSKFCNCEPAGETNVVECCCDEYAEEFKLLAAAPAQAQHSVPEGWMLVPVEPLLNMMSDKDHDTRITAERQLLSILAAAPGKEVGHE